VKDHRGREISRTPRNPRQSILGGRGVCGTRVFSLVLCVVLWMGPTWAWAAPQVSEEYQIKAAFLYNFIKFVEWPKGRFPGESEPIVIGVVGKDPFGEVLDQVAQKPVKDRGLKVRRFPSVSSEDADPIHPQLDALRQCHVLFICPSEKKATGRLLAAVADSAVLTIGDAPGFLEEGGMINFLVEDRKVRFEIGLAKARTAKLDISSQLLRLAKRVVEDK
jgi:hypothetical protein